MTEAELQLFRDRCRLFLIERLCLAQALSEPVLSGKWSAEQSRKLLGSWLEEQSKKADKLFGTHFREPALTALYGDEMREVVEEMKKVIDDATDILKAQGL